MFVLAVRASQSGTLYYGCHGRTCGPRVGEDEGSGDTNSTAQTHDRRKAALANKRGRDSLPVQHQTRADGAYCCTVGPVRGAGVADYARKVSSVLVSRCAQSVEGRQGGWEAYGSLSMSCSVLAMGRHCAVNRAAIAYWVLAGGDLVRHNGLVPDSGVVRRHCALLAGCGRAACWPSRLG